MTRRSFRIPRPLLRVLLFGLLLVLLLVAGARSGRAQAISYEHTYRQPKSTVEKALKDLQASMSGHLPALEGFALPGDYPFDRYQRAFYQSAAQVRSNASGGSVVRVSTTVTAWYTDSTRAHSGYQLLTSNGRLESDLLDELTDLLGNGPSSTRSDASSDGSSNRNPTQSSGDGLPTLAPAVASNKPPGIANQASGATISAPVPQFPQTRHTFSSSSQPVLSPRQLAETKDSPDKVVDRQTTDLQAEAVSLEEVLKNQAHPKNLVAIKKSGTPVVASPSLNSKTLFLATAHDEFEMLDFNADWVHVRISGLSRGWIWRTSLEMPDGISDVPLNGASSTPVVADLFQVTREEAAPFPGDWEPLRGKSVKIVSVQKIQENEKNSGAQAKLEFAKSLLDKNYAELAAKSRELFGIVLIFDSVDGGMIAATLSTVQQWKAGKLSDAALWHQCYFDPPETFTLSSASENH
jgi:hypothetical protein